jgi:twitching motility two-component system response regulator PilH
MSDKIILVIEDEEDIRYFIKMILEDEGYCVQLASNAEEGWVFLTEKRPNLVCIDILMPKESGLSLYRKLKCDKKLKDVPVVIISGLNLKKDLQEIEYRFLSNDKLLKEPEGVIEKPIVSEVLVKEVKRILKDN